MTKQDKLKRLLEMQEHPERYTETEIRQLMADEDCRLLYEQMVRATDALFSEKGEERGERKEEREMLKSHSSKFKPILKLAALFVGVLLLSGIAYAAIHYARSAGGKERVERIEERVGKDVDEKQLETQPNDSTLMKPVVFEDKELGTILSEIAAFHQCEVVYQSEAARHVRLYFTWDKGASIDEVIGTFNKFERIHITRENQQLIVR